MRKGLIGTRRIATGAATVAALAMMVGCKAGPPDGAGRGKARYAICAPCHGDNGAGRKDVEAPAIAGMSKWYLTAQLNKFRNGIRGAHKDDVEGLRMRPMSKTLFKDVDVDAVADYVSKMTPQRPVATLTGGDAKRGAPLFAACTACHGPDGKGKVELKAPSLLLTHDWYLARQIHKFKDGVRGTSALDVTGGQMRPMALTLTNKQAVLDVVAYIATLK